MSAKTENIEIPFKAGADLSALQYMGVTVTADDTVSCGVATTAIGILQNKPKAAGRAARVVVLGRTRAMFGSDITVNDEIACTTSGWIISAVSGTDFPMGRATKDANSGYVGEVVLGIGAGPPALV